MSSLTYEAAREAFYSRGSSKKNRDYGYDLSESDDGMEDDDADCFCD